MSASRSPVSKSGWSRHAVSARSRASSRSWLKRAVRAASTSRPGSTSTCPTTDQCARRRSSPRRADPWACTAVTRSRWAFWSCRGDAAARSTSPKRWCTSRTTTRWPSSVVVTRPAASRRARSSGLTCGGSSPGPRGSPTAISSSASEVTVSRSPTRWRTKSTRRGADTGSSRMRTRPSSTSRFPDSREAIRISRRNRAFPPTMSRTSSKDRSSSGEPTIDSARLASSSGVSGGSSTRSIIPSCQSRAIGSGAMVPDVWVAARPASPVATSWLTSTADASSRCSTSSTTRIGRRPSARAAMAARSTGSTGSPVEVDPVGRSDARLPSGSTADPGVAVTTTVAIPWERSRSVTSLRTRLLPTPSSPTTSTPVPPPASSVVR